MNDELEDLRCQECGRLIVKYEMFYGTIEAKCYRCNAMTTKYENIFTAEMTPTN